MKKIVDARGLSCPLPVLKTRAAIEETPQEIEVLVDNKTAVENVTRLAKNRGYAVEIRENAQGEWQLFLRGKNTAE